MQPQDFGQTSSKTSMAAPMSIWMAKFQPGTGNGLPEFAPGRPLPDHPNDQLRGLKDSGQHRAEPKNHIDESRRQSGRAP